MAGNQNNRAIGVLALQGNVSEHIDAFVSALADRDLTIPVIPIRKAEEIPDLLALAIPGGESTTIMRLIEKNGMREPITSFSGGIFATCAGMVVMAEQVEDEDRFSPLGMIPMTVNRNAFGRQRESFETTLEIKGLPSPFHAIFIRAPVGISAGPGVDIIAKTDQGIVGGVSGRHMVLAFHPEISGDLRLHQLFLDRLLAPG